jgi:hypothetical protein
MASRVVGVGGRLDQMVVVVDDDGLIGVKLVSTRALFGV